MRIYNADLVLYPRRANFCMYLRGILLRPGGEAFPKAETFDFYAQLSRIAGELALAGVALSSRSRAAIDGPLECPGHALALALVPLINIYNSPLDTH